MADRFIGLMSGTSLDGVDAVLAERRPSAPAGLQALAHVHMEMPPGLRAELLALNQPGDDELHRSALAAEGLVDLYTRAVQQLLAGCGARRDGIRALGAHGQTVRHRPGCTHGGGYTLQLINGALLAEKTGIDVVCDFRSRDLAAGGQGAPLVPAFHAACFARPGQDIAVLNLGGIANLTLLPAQGPVRGFDTGPANVLLDLWCLRHRGERFDKDGRWAASGQCNEALLRQWLEEPYFQAAPPKSTGRDLFNAAWLDARVPTGLGAADVMATLAALTVRTVVDALLQQLPGVCTLLVCGGGAYNRKLLSGFAALLPDTSVQTTSDAGLPVDQVEALAFAWLAQSFVNGTPGNLPAVTGARGSRVLGALYPGNR